MKWKKKRKKRRRNKRRKRSRIERIEKSCLPVSQVEFQLAMKEGEKALKYIPRKSNINLK